MAPKSLQDAAIRSRTEQIDAESMQDTHSLENDFILQRMMPPPYRGGGKVAAAPRRWNKFQFLPFRVSECLRVSACLRGNFGFSVSSSAWVCVTNSVYICEALYLAVLGVSVGLCLSPSPLTASAAEGPLFARCTELGGWGAGAYRPVQPAQAVFYSTLRLRPAAPWAVGPQPTTFCADSTLPKPYNSGKTV